MFKGSKKGVGDRELAEKAEKWLDTCEGGHSGEIHALAVLPNGLVVSGGVDATIQCWQVAEGEKVKYLMHLAAWETHCSVYALAVLPNGLVVSGGAGKTIQCWQVGGDGKAQYLATWEGHSWRVYALAVLPNRLVVSGSGDKTIKCWQVGEEGKARCLATWEGHLGEIRALAVLPNGLVVSVGFGEIKCWQVGDDGKAQCLATSKTHSNKIYALAVLPNGLVVSGGFGETKCWQVGDDGKAQCLATWEGHRDRVTALAVLPNGLVVSGGYMDDLIECWQVGDDGKAQQLDSWFGGYFSYTVDALAALPNGLVVSGSSRSYSSAGELRCWQGVFAPVVELQQRAEDREAFAQYQLGLAYYTGRPGEGVEQDMGKAVDWWQLAAGQGFAKAQQRLQEAQESMSQLAPASPQDNVWQCLKIQRQARKQDSVIEKGKMIEEDTAAVDLPASSFLSVSDSDGAVIESGMMCEVNGHVDEGISAPGGVGVGSAELMIEADLKLVPSSDVSQWQMTLTAYQLTCLLGAWHSELVACVNALGVFSADTDTLLQVDKHSRALAELYALMKQSATVDVHVYSVLMKVLGRCVPVYQLVGSDDGVEAVLLRLEQVALLVHQAIDVVGQAHWLLRHQVLRRLQVIASEYAVVSKLIAESGDVALRRYQGRASIAVLGEGYYHAPVAVARQLLCVDEMGKEVKANQAGSHAVVALNGVHYKPNSKAEFPINPGKEHAVSSLMQLIAGQSLAAAPSTLLSVSNVPIQAQGKEKQMTMTGNLVQGGLTVTGMCFKDFIECREALASWQARLSTKTIIALLEDAQCGFQKALMVAKQAYPSVFGAVDMSVESERAALSERLREAFESVCAGKAVEAQLRDIAESAGRPEANRGRIFRGLFESFLSAGGTVDALRALLGVIGQTPELMAGNDIAGLLQQFKQAKRIVKLLPNTPLANALAIVPQLLTERYLDTEAMSALWIGLLLTIPCDGKFDNFMLQLDYGADKQLQRCRIVAIDNDLSLKMPFSVNEEGQLSLELKNLLIVLPELMNLPIHPAVRRHCLSLSPEGWYLTWLSVLAKGDSDYQQWLAQGTVSETALKAIDIPVQLKSQVWQFIKTRWQELHTLLQSDAKVTLGQCFTKLYPLVDKAYQGLTQLDSPLPGPLAAEANLYQFFKIGGSCPVERLLPKGWPDELAQTQCADKASPVISANQQVMQEVVQLDWAKIAPSEQWPRVEALSLLPGLTLQDWQGMTEEHITSRLQGWFRDAVGRGRPFVAQRLLDLGASVSLPDESENTALHQFCASYLNYEDSETVRLMSHVLLSHHSCQPNQYNASGYTPLLQWVNVTPEPEQLTPAQLNSASVLLEVLLIHGANLEAKDAFKHETALDKTMKQGREKWHWFEVLVNKGAGVHANGEVIVKRLHESGILAKRPALQAALKQLTELNLSVAWTLSQQVWQSSSGKQSKSAIVVNGSRCGEVVLPQAIAKGLLTDKQVFNVKGETTDYGRRVVKAIEHDNAKWHVKENPEMPGIEMAVGALSRLLFGEHTAPNEVFSFFDVKGVGYPVLISQTVQGANLQTVLNDPKKAHTHEVLQQLHPQYTSEQIILAMLVHPEDGKPDNYQLLEMKTTRPDGKDSTQYRLIGIDNDHAFVKPVMIEKGHRKLQVKCVLFCLDTMRRPVHLAVRQRLLHLNPVTFLESWLDQLIAYHEGSMKLFDKKARQRLFKVKTDLKQLARKVALREVRERLPVVVTVPFRDGAITELWDRLVRMQDALRDNPMITHLQLLKAITPSLGMIYDEAFEVHEEPFEVAERFHEVANTHYSTAIAGRYATLTTSRQALEAAGFSDKEQKALLEEGDKSASFTPRHALFQLRQGVEQKAKIATTIDRLAKGDMSVFEQILSEQVKEDVVNRLDFSKMLIAGGKQPDIAKQKAILKLIINEQIAFHTLSIRHCGALTDDMLISLLKNAPELSRLTLIDCPQLTDKLGKTIEKLTPNVTTLTLRQLPNLEGLGNKVVARGANQDNSYDPINLPHLRRVNISDNLQLCAIAVQSRALTLATTKHNPLLAELTLFCEGLKALDVSGCAQLTDKGLQNTLQSYQALPRLNVDNCAAINTELWHCVAYVSQQAVSVFPQWNLKTWKQAGLLLLPYASDRVVQIDSGAIEPNQLTVVMGLVASNPGAHTVLVTVSPKSVATVLNPLLALLKNNTAIAALCITGASLDNMMAEHMILAVATCGNLHTVALTVDNSQAAIAQLQQVTQLTQVMVNGVNVTSLLQADKATNGVAIVNDASGQQAMSVDVLALAMQHESSAIRQSAANTLALLSAAGKLPECKQRIAELLSGENPTLLTVQHAESVNSSSSVSIVASSSSSAALISQFSGIAQQQAGEVIKEKEREKEEASDSDDEHTNVAKSSQQIAMRLG